MKIKFSNLLILTILPLVQSCSSSIEKQSPQDSEAVAEIHTINFIIPKEFIQKSDAQKDPAGDLIYSRWENPNGVILEVMEWPTGPVVDRGIMIAASEEPIVVAEQNTKLILTKVFFGSDEEVYCIHLHKDKTRYVISGEDFEKEKFIQILETAKITKK